MENKYPIKIEWSEMDGEFLATCPAFSHLSAFGETEEEALKEAQIVRQLFIDTFIREGIELPFGYNSTPYVAVTVEQKPEAISSEGREDLGHE